MKLWKADSGVWLERGGSHGLLDCSWDELMQMRDLNAYLGSHKTTDEVPNVEWRAPIGMQEVWAAGVTYLRSRSARVEESRAAGGGSFYDRVYDADRPELFFKSAHWRVVGNNGTVRIRDDAKWSVPEPELVACVNAFGDIVGFTIGNDMSSRDIEGENPLYLPQAKIYNGSCAIGPAMLVADEPPAPDTQISMRITRQSRVVFEGATSVSQLRRQPKELVGWLYRELEFPVGCMLFTGTGVIPPDAFTLSSGDAIEMEITPIGTLRTVVA